jgi:hypothetical protein
VPGFHPVGQVSVADDIAAETTSMAADAGAYSLSGQAATFQIAAVFAVGGFVLSGQAADLTRPMTADAGTYTLSGQDVMLLPGLERGAFTISGEATLSLLEPSTTRRALFRPGSGVRGTYWRGRTN